MTYKQAIKLATKKNPNVVYTGDAGNGLKFQVYYCPWRKRQIWASINPEGMLIV